MEYVISEARYAKNMMAVRCPSNDHFKSRAAVILESVAPRSIRWSGRERSYIVSKATVRKFLQAVEEYSK